MGKSLFPMAVLLMLLSVASVGGPTCSEKEYGQGEQPTVAPDTMTIADPQERYERESFLAICSHDGRIVWTDTPGSRRECICVWNELRDHYTSGEIDYVFNDGVMDSSFAGSLAAAIEGCER